jgi:CspA family cold shock protein|tara:strand:+ start:3841 stop:4449 length:609 start_codon:yes stop_codon:yes gene_type:complete
MTMSDENGAVLQKGLVKWFDPGKGYGFILNEQGGADILLHANVLRNFGRSSVADQSLVTFYVQPTARGLQASEIVSIEPPESDGTAPIADLDNGIIEHLDQLPLHPARVKWFDKSKGFGFANIFGHPEDVFLHVEVLRHSGFADLAIGEAIALRVVEGPRGLMAAQIASWDQGMTTQGGGSAEIPGPFVDDSDEALLAHVAE